MDHIKDGTTLPLYDQLAPNELLVPYEMLEKHFLSLAEVCDVPSIDRAHTAEEHTELDLVDKALEFPPRFRLALT